MDSPHKTVWQRAIILVDMNCFFAQIEQYDNPIWLRRPVAVTNGRLGSTIITASYEARAYGVKTGMRLKQARVLCPELIQAPSRPNRYAEISTKIMTALEQIIPDIEIYSVDEAFLDVTQCQKLHGSPEAIAQMVKNVVRQACGLTCSIGLSSDKTTAKFAAKLQKPDGLTVIPPWQAEARLANERVTELSGISDGIDGFLNKYGVYSCGDMKNIPISILAKRFGNLGRRIWLMAQGKDPEPVITTIKDPKTIGHGKVMPPGTRDLPTLLIYMQHMAEKVAARLRRYHFQAKLFFIGLKTHQGWLGIKAKIDFNTDDGKIIYQLCYQFVTTHWAGQQVRQVQITAISPTQYRQPDLFLDNAPQLKREKINRTVDLINEKYGEFTVAPMRVIGRSEMPNVIAPAWKPTGHRKTI